MAIKYVTYKVYECEACGETEEIKLAEEKGLWRQAELKPYLTKKYVMCKKMLCPACVAKIEKILSGKVD